MNCWESNPITLQLTTPMANGLVERLHRQLKASIMARTTGPDWMDQLPMVMLGIRTAWRTELDASPAELVYGTALTVPGTLVDGESQGQDRQGLPTAQFVTDLFRTMRDLSPTEMAHHANNKVHLPSSLENADLVYVRTDAVRQPLVRPYTGPYRVIEKSDKFFKIMKNGNPDNVSIDRLKPAYVYNNNSEEKLRKNGTNNTQPLTKNPETDENPAKTGEVAAKDYRAALMRDLPRQVPDTKRKYEKRKNELHTEIIATRTGRISRPGSRL